MRKPVSSHVAADTKEMVLCDDGSAWKRDNSRAEWYEFPEPIPSTKHAIARERTCNRCSD